MWGALGLDFLSSENLGAIPDQLQVLLQSLLGDLSGIHSLPIGHNSCIHSFSRRFLGMLDVPFFHLIPVVVLLHLMDEVESLELHSHRHGVPG